MPVTKLKEALATNLQNCLERHRESKSRCMFHALQYLAAVKMTVTPAALLCSAAGSDSCVHQLLADATCCCCIYLLAVL